ncbi:Zinc finger MYM-type protein 1 [Holothuria leucospilota]|uniref:Zinc finger MYM-type protein 1 n=1 Tax=Holothuria leucospilota TaxID=206669 RepID=A0A9Q0YQM3_HOLLE|nr:Zinc finger MYM-type protein 1 [Holothuria leucospilota]
MPETSPPAPPSPLPEASPPAQPVAFPQNESDPRHPQPQDHEMRDHRIKQGPYQPSMSFPKRKCGDRQRSFNPLWYREFPWLEYSPEKDAMFCFSCRFFCKRTPYSVGHINQSFVSKGTCRKNWKDAKEVLRKHGSSMVHKNAELSRCTYLKSIPISQQLDSAAAASKRVRDQKQQENKNIMRRIIDVVLLLARTSHPLRGHDESDESLNKGLFLEILELLGRYDETIKKHLENSARNARYTSPDIQNDILSSAQEVILKEISLEVNDAPFVSVIMDEATDVTHHEQAAIIVRYVDKDMTI